VMRKLGVHHRAEVAYAAGKLAGARGAGDAQPKEQ
jgi:DNA-binding NarL/FixJ family response regulator